MPNIRGILTFALPAVTVVFGFIWYFGRKKSPKPKLLEKKETNSDIQTTLSSVSEQNNTDPSQNSNNGYGDGSLLQKAKVNVEIENSNNDASASPASNRKRKAFQITRTDDTEVSDGPDSVDEEMNQEDQIIPKLSQSVSSGAPTPSSQAEISGGKSQGKIQKKEPCLNGSPEPAESELSAVNESIVIESASQSMLFGEKTSLMNDAFMTSGISEQSILGEKDKQCKVQDISLSTSLSEPLLESTMLDTTQSQPPPAEVVEEVVRKESSVLETVPSVNTPTEAQSSKQSRSQPSSVSENVAKQSKDNVSSMNGTREEKNSMHDKKKEKNSHTADKTETDKHKTVVDNKKSSSPKHMEKNTASSTKIENHHNEHHQKSKHDVHQKFLPQKDRPVRKTHSSGGSDHAMDNGVHGSDSNSSGCDNVSEVRINY